MNRLKRKFKCLCHLTHRTKFVLEEIEEPIAAGCRAYLELPNVLKSKTVSQPRQ